MRQLIQALERATNSEFECDYNGNDYRRLCEAALRALENAGMTEQDYIRATNLAKIRAAKQVLRDYFHEEDEPEDDMREAMNLLSKMERRLEALVKTE